MILLLSPSQSRSLLKSTVVGHLVHANTLIRAAYILPERALYSPFRILSSPIVSHTLTGSIQVNTSEAPVEHSDPELTSSRDIGGGAVEPRRRNPGDSGVVYMSGVHVRFLRILNPMV